MIPPASAAWILGSQGGAALFPDRRDGGRDDAVARWRREPDHAPSVIRYDRRLYRAFRADAAGDDAEREHNGWNAGCCAGGPSTGMTGGSYRTAHRQQGFRRSRRDAARARRISLDMVPRGSSSPSSARAAAANPPSSTSSPACCGRPHGHVLYDGQPVHGPNRRVGYMTQKDTLLPWRTAEDNIGIALELRCRARRRGRAATASHADHGAGRPQGLRAALPGGAVRRHARARRAGAHADLRARDAAAGRAVRRARCPAQADDAAGACRASRSSGG